MDKQKRPSNDLSVYNSAWYLQKKADTIILRMQQALGRTASSKSQYMSVHHGETFNKKHIRILSVVLFLGCVLSAAICCGIYYAVYWKPCTKKILYPNPCIRDETCASETHELWIEYAWTKNEKTSACTKCFKGQGTASLPKKRLKTSYFKTSENCNDSNI